MSGAGPVGERTGHPGEDHMAGPGPLPGDLAPVDEPVALRDAWWAAERDGSAGPDLVGEVTAAVRAAWSERLGAAGVEAGWLDGVTAGYRRELWLWLVGERQWDQCLAGLAGRVVRRLPA